MPYASDAQRRFFHTDTARSKGITPATVKEFDTASKGMSLPKKVGPKKVAKKPRKKRAVKFGAPAAPKAADSAGGYIKGY